MSHEHGFTDVQVSVWVHWECGTCGAHGEAGPFEDWTDAYDPEHDCEEDE